MCGCSPPPPGPTSSTPRSSGRAGSTGGSTSSSTSTDRCVECSLPDLAERVEILEVVGRGLGEVALEEVAGVTEGLSGADLRALVYTAELEAREEAVSTSHLLAAAAATRPSVTPTEAAR